MGALRCGVARYKRHKFEERYGGHREDGQPYGHTEIVARNIVNLVVSKDPELGIGLAECSDEGAVVITASRTIKQ